MYYYKLLFFGTLKFIRVLPLLIFIAGWIYSAMALVGILVFPEMMVTASMSGFHWIPNYIHYVRTRMAQELHTELKTLIQSLCPWTGLT